MNNKTMLYTLIFIVLFFLVIDFITLFTRGPNFDVIFYESNISTNYSTTATITTTSGLKFKNEKKKIEYLQIYKDTSKQTFEKYFSEISKEIGKDISVIDVKSYIKERDGILEITESVVLKGLVEINQEVYTLDMGKVKINPVENSNLKVILPDDAIIESIEPTPTVQIKNFVTWKGSSATYFPKIVYKRREK